MPRDGTATRERILTSAEQLVIDNGYAATSVDQVIAASGSSKGAFFHHFDSKLDLARSLVERYATADIGQLDAALEHARATTRRPGRAGGRVRRATSRTGPTSSCRPQSSCLYVSILAERQLVLAGRPSRSSRRWSPGARAWRTCWRGARGDRAATSTWTPWPTTCS